jgi:hypothetical protein
MLFSLVHPSRQRVDRAAEAIREWHAGFSGKNQIEHLLSVDEDDAWLEDYRALAQRAGVGLVVGRNRSLVDAANRAARAVAGDFLIVVSDDFGCPPGWDLALAGIAGERRDIAILVNDGSPTSSRLMTLPIVGRALYERLGFLYHPDYFSMFADDDITGTARARGALVAAPGLLFPHRHYSFGLAEADPTYLRQNALDKWWLGWRLFERRRAGRFGLDPPSLQLTLRRMKIDAYYLLRVGGNRVRKHWLAALPPPLRRVEGAVRDAVLRGARRITGVDARP